MKLTINLSYQAIRLIDQIAERGIWGATREEVATRMVDQALQGFIEPPRFGVAVEQHETHQHDL